MVVSWVTDYQSPAVVRYGLKANQLDMTATSTDIVQYTSFGETSGYIHHVPLTNLKPSTQYFYQIGDATTPDGSAGLRYFTTLPKVGKRIKNFQLAVAADIGQTNDSLVTIDHLIADQESALLLLAGDTSYADCAPKLWDYWFNLMQVKSLGGKPGVDLIGVT
jgi:acid phosphatase type 7